MKEGMCWSVDENVVLARNLILCFLAAMAQCLLQFIEDYHEWVTRIYTIWIFLSIQALDLGLSVQKNLWG